MARFYLDKSDPQAWQATRKWADQITASVTAAGLHPAVVELMSLRISQINGCAFCLDTHTHKALMAGLTKQQLGVLAAWREAEEMFSEVERAALAIGEAATLLPAPDLRRAELARARELLTDEQYSALQWVAIRMNVYNRVSILSEHPVRPRE
ncbi:alkylhydroperoxidase AhpD family core domain-containing protein [Raineyella antarctica]|uniref:Alkylhydroperoxidase AhpD family core domain-containing protein n=1 Tax=Raineyella antarctica TaxID=1577474 RepID=A0A1G6H8U5_9ACTN|nr:carboxymuconolactone decarboxylase family protein [Raineyella antarctica]SDB89846.1 alkylhydroperoxidase AhpD family core domain-containing protein [Raineyella antarctica]